MGWDAEKLEYWSTHYKNWQSSGLTQNGYCEQEVLSLSSFTRWNKRVRSNAKAQKAGTAPMSAQALTLVPLRIADDRCEDRFVLRSNRSWQLQLPASTKVDWLVELLKHLP